MKLLLSLFLFSGWMSAVAGSVPTYTIETVVGSAPTGDGGPATAAQLGAVQGVAADRWGNLYFSESDNHRVRKVDISGAISTFAGTGSPGFSGDGGPATGAQLNLPYGLAVDFAGNVYIADLGNLRVRRVSPDGKIVTIAGNGAKGSLGDGGPAVNAQLFTPRNVAVDAAGNLYISEFEGHRVRKVAADGSISTAVGTGIAGFRGDGGPAFSAQLAFPAGLAVDRLGNLYIADSQNQRIRKVLPGGIVSTLLGGDPGTALVTPIAVAVDSALTVYAADGTGVVRSYSAAKLWSNVAGTGAPGFSGDGGPAAAAQLSAPRELAVNLTGALFIADGSRVREVNPRQIISTVAGDGYLHAVGDGGPAGSAQLYQPSAVALDFTGNLYIADTGTQRIRVVTPGGVIQTAAGTGAAGYNSDQIAATAAQLNSPMGVALDVWGNLFAADTYNHRVRKVGVDHRITTYAGTGTGGVGPEMLVGSQTLLRGPRSVCLNRAGTVFIVDTANHRVLRAPPGSVVSTAAGNGGPGNAGDGSPATMAQLNQPGACALDSAGDLYIADTANNRIRKVTPDGLIATVAGDGGAGFGGDGAPATAAQLNAPDGVSVDDNGDIFIADTGNNRIRLVTSDGAIHTIAGSGARGFSGDGGAAVKALLGAPAGLTLDGAGNLYFADTMNNRVRRLVLQTVAADSVPIALPPALTVVNAASLLPGAVAPGETISIMGAGLGPRTGAPAATDASGLVSNLLAGAEVRFDGVPTALFYAQASQINAQVPYTVAGASLTHMEVRYLGQIVAALDLPVAAAAPAIYPTTIDQDGGLNSPAAPAARGSVVTLYATGEGLTTGSNVTGQIAAPPYPRPAQAVTLTIAGVTAQIQYAGAAPGFAGMLQINAVVPGGFVSAGQQPVVLTVGTAVSPSIAIWIE